MRKGERTRERAKQRERDRERDSKREIQQRERTRQTERKRQTESQRIDLVMRDTEWSSRGGGGERGATSALQQLDLGVSSLTAIL